MSGNTELEAQETAENNGIYVIIDKHGRISDSTIDSKTIFPELVIDNSTNIYFYDYPGFSDTRGSHNDIATSYFINKVLERVQAVKLVFVVGYPSVSKGVDRQDFLKLLKHATELVKDIDKYKQSIALVVTKVDNHYRRRGKNLIFVEDDQIIRGIGTFLEEAKLTLENRVQNFENTFRDTEFNKNSLKFIDILLSKNENGFSKIGIFRRPEEPGSIGNSTVLNEENKHIYKVLQTLTFTYNSIKDFGYTLSEKSLVEINDLVKEINNNISHYINCIIQQLHTHYNKLVKLADTKISSFDMNSSNSRDFAAIKTYLSEINEGYDVIENVTLQIKNINNVQDFTKSLSQCVFDLNALNSIKKVMSGMSTESRYFDFLQAFIGDHSYKATIITSWASSFQEFLKELVKIKTGLESSIHILEKEIKIKFKHDIANIQESITTHFTEKEKEDHDIKVLYQYFQQEHDKISTLYKLTSGGVPNHYVSEICNYLTKFNIFIEELTLSMLYESEFSEILKQAIQINVKYVHDTLKYYSFLNALFTKLSVYDIQKDTSQLFKLSQEITESEENKRVLDTSMEQFLKKCCYTEFISQYNCIKNVRLNQYKLKTLKKIFTITLKHDIDAYCKNDENELVVKGYFVKLSEVLFKQCPKSVTNIKVFALHTVFIDIDFISAGIQISIIAPMWDVEGPRSIILDGSTGQSLGTAMSGLYPGTKGADGKPGLPGGVGGTFFGIGAFVNGSGSLYISANGGNGGPGQNGGNGVRGVDGTIPYTSDPENYLIDKGLYYDGYITRKKFGCALKACGYYNYYEWNILGENCGDGGKGGNGGHGGLGGYPGLINTIFLTSNVKVTKINTMGQDGVHGKGGAGGSSGSTGQVLTLIQGRKFPNNRDFNTEYKNLHECSPGTSGNTVNENGIQKSKKLHMYESYILNEFKTYLRQSLTDTLTNSFLLEFNESIDKSTSAKNLYDISGLLKEFYSLENELYNVIDKKVLVPFYRSLLNRIDECQTKYSNNYKTFQYLRIATLSTLYRIVDLQDYLVVDIKEYFGLLEKHIKQYQRSLKQVKIDTNKNQYSKILYSHIHEAESIIRQSIMPEIDDIYNQIDNQISFLIKDIRNQQLSIEKEKNDLIEKQKKLANQLSLLGFIEALKFTGHFLAIAVPGGQLAGQLIGTGADIVDNIAFDKTENLISNIKKSFEDIKTHYEKEQKNLKKNLEISMKEEGTNRTDLEIDKIMTPLQDSLDKADVIAYKEIKESTKIKLQQAVQILADKKEALIKTIKMTGLITPINSTETSEQKFDKRLKYIQRLQNSITVAEVGFDSIKNTKEAGNLIIALGHSIRSHDEQISKLKNYEISIYRYIVPMKSDLENIITKMGSKLSNKSHVTLDVQKWKIDSIIKDFQTDIGFMIQASDPKTKSKVMACLDKLQNGISTLVRVYDIIQDYQDNVKLSNYIADLNSDVKISDDEQINSDLNKLEVIIKSNLVLQEYEKATTAFKQYMFPFASLYFEMFNVPTPSNNITDLVHSASLQINLMADELTKQTTVVQKNAHQLFPDISFDNTKHEQEPFYVWDTKKNKKEITDLLTGKEVVLTADITKAVNKNALKFKELSLQFIIFNEQLQKEFDRLSQGFLVNMTHSGNSYYRCDERHYLVTHSGINMKHSMCKDTSGHYYYLDMTSTILKQNPPMFSPYTTWHVQLLQKDDHGNNSFEMFDKYADWVKKLSLEGRGQYVGLNLDVCNDNLDKYYQRVNV